MINYGGLFSGLSADTVADPQQLFQALPNRARKFAYLRDVQSEVLAQWFSRSGVKDSVIKMNTGGGKSVVGLLALKSCLNRQGGPAVYVAPDHYLCDQVIAEAGALGLATTKDPRSLEYSSGSAILVVPVHTLFNGKSKFGVGRNVKLPIGAIVIDDAHACLSVAEEKFTLRVLVKTPVYDALFKLFYRDLASQTTTGTLEVERGDPRALVEVPFWAWQSKHEQVARVLLEHEKDSTDLEFALPLLKDDLSLCRCIFHARSVEISFRCLPSDVITSFARAKTRIFMTATLADDSILITDFGADPEAVSKPITPRNASDLGERMILAPQAINTDVTDTDIKNFVARYKSRYNVVVVVPSGERAKFWADVASPGETLTAENLHAGVESLRSRSGQLAVLINKYDGVDLPDDAARILVLDGLPDTRRLVDRMEQSILGNSERQRARHVQRVEQGMGRGIRSNEDYCAVILMGSQLLSALYSFGGDRYLSPASRRQLALSMQIGAEMQKKGLEALSEPINDLLTRNPGWTSAARNALIGVSYPDFVTVDRIAIAQRAAFDAARNRRFEIAEERLREVVPQDDPDVGGWLLAQVAAVVNPLDKIRSQEILAAASQLNRGVTKPLTGVLYRRVDTVGMDQAQQAGDYLRRRYRAGSNAAVIGLNGLLENLVFDDGGDDSRANAFEQAMMDLGLHLGFSAQRPEREGSPGLDVLWGLGALQYLLLPCKSNATAPRISKQYTDQVSGNMNWFRKEYDASCTAIPAIVHPSRVLDPAASPPPEMRVITPESLAKLASACRVFITAIKDRTDDQHFIRQSLSANGLLGPQIIERYTVVPRAAKL